MKLYMAVTADKYELPLIVSSKRQELADYAGVTVRTVDSSISRHEKGTRTGIRFIKIMVDDKG